MRSGDLVHDDAVRPPLGRPQGMEGSCVADSSTRAQTHIRTHIAHTRWHTDAALPSNNSCLQSRRNAELARWLAGSGQVGFVQKHYDPAAPPFMLYVPFQEVTRRRVE